MHPATITLASQRLRSIVCGSLKHASSLRLALLSALTLAVTLAATVAPARLAPSVPVKERLALPVPVGAVTQAYVDAVAPAPQPESSGTPSLEEVLNPDGSLRAGLSGSFDASGFAVTYGPDGGPRFVPVSTSSTLSDGYARFPYNVPNDNVLTVAVVGSDVYVGGFFTGLGGIPEANRIAKWNGSAWSALGGGANGVVRTLAVSGNGVYVGGNFTTVYSSGTTTVAGTGYIARWDGTSWSALGGGATGTVYAIAVSGSDVYVGGEFSGVYSSGTTMVDGTRYIVKWDGSAWSVLGGGTSSTVYAVAVSGSDVYVGGRFLSVYSSGTTEVTGTSRIAKWNGSAWSALGGGAQNWVYAIVVSGSDVYVGGEFSTVYSSGTTPVAATGYVARWDGSAWSALGGGVNNVVRAIAVSGSDVYIGGFFSSAYSSGTTPVDGTSRIAKWNGSAWSALGGGAQNDVQSIAVSGSNVYVGGSFGAVYSSGTTEVVGTWYIAKWDGSAWSAAIAVGKGSSNPVLALAVSGSDVYVGGNFRDLGGIAEADGIARWDGSAWRALGSGVNGAVQAIAVRGSDVYVGGVFTDFGGIAEADYVAKWNGSAWSALGGGASGNVNAIAVTGTNVYVGGRFSTVYSSGTTPVAGTGYIARWDGSAWHALGSGVNNVVHAIAASGSDVYAGGEFSNAGSVPGTRYIARWDGSAWNALGTGGNSSVLAIATSGAVVYVGGYFTSVHDGGGTPVPSTRYIAKWNGSAWSALGTGTQYGVFAIAVNESDVYVGGGFPSVLDGGGAPVAGTRYIAKWNGSAWSALGSGVDAPVFALAFGAASVAQAAVPALYIGGEFTAASDGTLANKFTYYTGSDLTPVGNDPEEGIATVHGALVTILGNGSGNPRVRIEGSGAVRAEVYDVLGRSVARVYDGEVSGTAEVSLPALSSGSYVVRVTSDGHATSHAVVVR
ncbi:MAG: T9SS type A sorting domain-containing protein [Bacteroidetes bacterium]|nr:T9SS type A sorting domain-containing protein [Bacteroidota bacterium]